MDAGRNNGNEREGNYKHGMGRQGRMEKENKTLGTGRCEKHLFSATNTNYCYYYYHYYYYYYYTSKFVDAGGYNRNEREGNFRLGMGRQRRVKKKEN